MLSVGRPCFARCSPNVTPTVQAADSLRKDFKLTLDCTPEPIVLRVYEHDTSLCQKEADLIRLNRSPVIAHVGVGARREACGQLHRARTGVGPKWTSPAVGSQRRSATQSALRHSVRRCNRGRGGQVQALVSIVPRWRIGDLDAGASRKTSRNAPTRQATAAEESECWQQRHS